MLNVTWSYLEILGLGKLCFLPIGKNLMKQAPVLHDYRRQSTVYRGYNMLLCHIERVSVDNARTVKQ